MQIPNKKAIININTLFVLSNHSNNEQIIIPIRHPATINKTLFCNQLCFIMSANAEYEKAAVPHSTSASCNIIGMLGRFGIVPKRKFGP